MPAFKRDNFKSPQKLKKARNTRFIIVSGRHDPKLQTKEESQESYDYETPISTSTTYIDVVQ